MIPQHQKLARIVADNRFQELKTNGGDPRKVQGFANQLLASDMLPKWETGTAGIVQLILYLQTDKPYFDRVKEAIEFIMPKIKTEAEEASNAALEVKNFLSAPSGIGTDTNRDRMVGQMTEYLRTVQLTSSVGDTIVERDETTRANAAAKAADSFTSAFYRMAGLDPSTGTYVGERLVEPGAPVDDSPLALPELPAEAKRIPRRRLVPVADPLAPAPVDIHDAQTGKFAMPVVPASRADTVITGSDQTLTTEHQKVQSPAQPAIQPQAEMPAESVKAPKSGKGLIVGGIITLVAVGTLVIGSITYALWPSGNPQTQNPGTGSAAIVQPVEQGLGAQLPSAPVLNPGTANPGTAAPVVAPSRAEEPANAGTGSASPATVQAVAAQPPATTAPAQVETQKPEITATQIANLKVEIREIIASAEKAGKISRTRVDTGKFDDALNPIFAKGAITVTISNEGEIKVTGAKSVATEVTQTIQGAVVNTGTTMPSTGLVFKL
jgi:hypothetical protein